MIWNLFIIVFFVNSVRSQATKSTENPKTENIFEKCCGLGKSWAKGGLKCDKFLGPVPGVSQIEQGLCLEAVDICCNRDDHEKSCDIGKNRARNGLGCSENNSNAQEKNNDHYQKDCCEGCKLGILTGSMGSGCVMTGFSFGIPWDPAFMECCKETETSTSTTETSQKTTKSTKGTSTDPATLSDDFNDSLELFDDDNSTTGEKPKNDCEILSGLLCSDICVPVDGSYRCECPEGSVLLDDQRTCKSETPINRCESDNPCEHRCKDNGTAVKCKCDPGFILADDEHSCEQKPPPTEPTTLPSTQKITTTTIGTTKKSTPKPTKTTTIKKTTTTKPIKTTTPVITTTIKKNPTTKKIITTPKLTTILTTVPTTIEMDTTTEIFTTTTEKPDKNLTTVSKNKGTTQAVKKSDKKPDNLPKCPTGYKYNAGAGVCDDVDECAENLHSCGTDICYNQPGGYTCARRPAPITPSPSSPAEVQPTLDPKNQKKCSTGLKYIRNRGCIDINECEETTEACTSNEDCVNTVGSFTCNCKTGFRRDALTQACVDINECQFEHNDCLPTQRCDNTLGSYICVRFLSCGTGYTLNAATESCEDDDECVLGTHDCSVGYHCRNTVGSFRCDRNPRGQAWTTSTTKKSTTLQLLTTTPRTTTSSSSIRPSPTTPLRTSLPIQTPTTTQAPEIDTRIDTVPRTCPRGFTRGSSNQCIDIDECQYGRPNPCSRVPMSRCINTIGSYQCISRVVCGPGYKIDQQNSATRCVDIDECEDGTHQCGRGQVCKNLPGHYACSCPHGYTIDDNNNCIDIDECRVFGRNPCGGNGKCENTNGSYKCNCDEGFDKIDGDMCQDVDECRNNPDICQHDCINMWGGYRCTCQHGFRLNQNDNRTCLDIDECEEFKENNLCVGFCDNTPGSYECRCPDGYQLGSDGRTCQDFDECSSGPVCRDFNDVCQNTRGGYKCNKIRCPIGYHRDEQRKNRCVRTSRYCPNGDLSCFRSPSHYSFNFITFISMFPIPQSTGQLDLFTMRGTHLPGSSVQFKKSLINVQAPPGLPRATESYFTLRNPSPSDAVLCLTRSIPGPQDIELELSMEIYHGTAFVGSAVAKLFIYVTQYEF